MSNGTKWCRGCARDVPLSGFASDRNRSDGLQPRCKQCVAAYGAEHYRRRQAALGKTVKEKVEVPQGWKLCRQCGEVKPHSAWHKNGTASDGLSTRCKACRAIQGRADHLKRSYGMTEAQRDEMIAAQGGLCCICLKRPAVHVDHCHTTGKVRGVLCFNCNTAIGKLDDDPDAARRAASYLEGHAWKPTIVAQGVYRQPS